MLNPRLKTGHRELDIIQWKLENQRHTIPALDELIVALVDQWGGPQGFARALYDVYKAAKKGSSVQVRIMERGWDLIKNYTQQMGHFREEYDHLTETQATALLEAMVSQKAKELAELNEFRDAAQSRTPVDTDAPADGGEGTESGSPS